MATAPEFIQEIAEARLPHTYQIESNGPTVESPGISEDQANLLESAARMCTCVHDQTGALIQPCYDHLRLALEGPKMLKDMSKDRLEWEQNKILLGIA